MQMNETKGEIVKQSNKNLLVWCCVLFVLFGFLGWTYIEQRNYLYTADEIDVQLCREIIISDIYELEELEVPLEDIHIVDIEKIDDTIIAGYICSDKYATRYGDKGYLIFRTQENGLYYVNEFYHEYNPVEMGQSTHHTDAERGLNRVTTAVASEYINQKAYFIFISDDPGLEKIYISGDRDFKQIELELDIAEIPYMNIVEMPEKKALYVTFKSTEVEPKRYIVSFM